MTVAEQVYSAIPPIHHLAQISRYSWHFQSLSLLDSNSTAETNVTLCKKNVPQQCAHPSDGVWSNQLLGVKYLLLTHMRKSWGLITSGSLIFSLQVQIAYSSLFIFRSVTTYFIFWGGDKVNFAILLWAFLRNQWEMQPLNFCLKVLR